MSLEQHYTAILGQLGEDVSREGLLDTPKRAAKAMQYLCKGYQQTLEEVTNGALFTSDNSEMVLVKNIELYSLCEHHMLPFIGKAHVAYLPNGKVLGLSKVRSEEHTSELKSLMRISYAVFCLNTTTKIRHQT